MRNLHVAEFALMGWFELQMQVFIEKNYSQFIWLCGAH